MRLTYIGPKPRPRTFPTPIPLLAKSEQTGTVTFDPTADVPDDWGRYLLETCPEAFRAEPPGVNAAAVVAAVAMRKAGLARKPFVSNLNLGRRFKAPNATVARARAQAHILKHGLVGKVGLKKLKIGDVILGYELAPISAPGAEGSEITPIPVATGGDKEGTHDDRDCRDEDSGDRSGSTYSGDILGEG